jgi:glycosyltransferase involved in cell wall biosynthesis
MNLPIIATDVSGSNEFVVAGANGWIVKVKDRLDLFTAMRESLILPTDRLVEMGVSGRTRVVNSFERSHYLSLLVQFYRSFF